MKRFILILWLSCFNIDSIFSQDFQHWREGKELLEKGAVVQSVEQFKKAVELKPDDLVYRNWLGSAYFDAGEYEKAVKHLEYVRERSPQKAWYLYLGKSYLNMGEHEKAEKIFNLGLKYEKDNKKLNEIKSIIKQLKLYIEYFNAGAMAFKNKKYSESIKLFEKALTYLETYHAKKWREKALSAKKQKMVVVATVVVVLVILFIVGLLLLRNYYLPDNVRKRTLKKSKIIQMDCLSGDIEVDKAISILEKLATKAEKLNLRSLKGKIYSICGEIYIGNKYTKKARDYFEKTNQEYKYCKLYDKVVKNYETIGEFEKAAFYYKKINNLEKCAQCYEKAKMFKDAGNIYLKIGQIKEAAENFEKYCSKNGNQYNVLEKLLDIYKKKKDDGNIFYTLERMFRTGKASSSDLHELAEFYYESKKFEKAAEVYEKLRSLNALGFEEQLRLLAHYQKIKEIDKFIKFAEEIQKEEELPIGILIKLGDNYYKKEMFKKAEETFQKILYGKVDLNRNTKESVRSKLIEVLIKSGETEKAVKECGKIPYSNTSEANMVIDYFLKIYGTSNLESVLKQLKDLHTDDSDWYRLLAERCLSGKLYKQAVSLYRLVQEKRKLNTSELEKLVKLYQKLDDFDGMEATYRKLAESDEKFLNDLIEFLISRKKTKEAIDECKRLPEKKRIDFYKRIIEIEPQNIYLHKLLAKFYSKERTTYLKAKKEWEIVLKAEPKNAKALKKLADLYFADKEYRKAEPLYQRLLEIKDSSSSHSNLGEIYFTWKDLLKARDHFKNFLSLIKMKKDKNNIYSMQHVKKRLLQIDETLKWQRIYIIKTVIGRQSNIVPEEEQKILPCVKEWFKEYEKMNTNELHMALGKIYFEMPNHYADAIAEFQGFVKDTEYGVEAQKMLGLCFIKNKHYASALSRFKKLIAQVGLYDKEVKDYFYMIAKTFEENNANEEAIAIYSEIESEDIMYRDASERIRILQERIADERKNPQKVIIKETPKIKKELVHTVIKRSRPTTSKGTVSFTKISHDKGEWLIGGKYELYREIGTGGMGIVYEAINKIIGKKVAVKKLKDEIKISSRERKKFLNEARTVANLKHPNIVDLYDIISEKEDVYIVFEYIDGKTLEDILGEQDTIKYDKAVQIILQVCEALKYAHNNKPKPIIHRDIKPSNIMINNRGVVKVMDFGIAREAKDTFSRITGKDTSGTLVYMAPEQHLGKYDKRSDIFSLGCTLYEMITGEAPFKGPDFLVQKERMTYIPAKEIVPDLPDKINNVINKCLQPEREKRYQTVEEFEKDLKG